VALIPDKSGIPKVESSPITTDQPSPKMSQKAEPVATASSMTKPASMTKVTKPGVKDGMSSSEAITTATPGKQTAKKDK
jgi:hypothetical protein